MRQINIIPNTGHHYYFFPLGITDEGSCDLSLMRERYELFDLSDTEIQKIVNYARANPDWNAAKNHAWMRAKVGYSILNELNSKGVAVNSASTTRAIGVWLVIESNLGNHDRGYYYLRGDLPMQPRWLKDERATWPNPYAGISAENFPCNSEEYDLLALFPVLGDFLITEVDTFRQPDVLKQVDLSEPQEDIVVPTYSFFLQWTDPDVGEPFPVDLIVDFGNSRTVALVLENSTDAVGANENELEQFCRPLSFTEGYDDSERAVIKNPKKEDYLIDSWFALRKPEFDEPQFSPPEHFAYDLQVSKEPRNGWFSRIFSPPKETPFVSYYKMPHMFTELSPAAIGAGAFQYFTCLKGSAVLTSLSSPKRYAWDSNSVGTKGGTKWHMSVGKSGELKKLSGEILSFMPRVHSERIYSLPEGYDDLMDVSPVGHALSNDSPDFPRSDGLVWSALTIIEKAHQTINTQAIRALNSPVKRFIQSIAITYPSGWTQEEIDAYYKAWVYARNIFYWSRYPRLPTSNAPAPEDWWPDINMKLNEAVASQLPVIYSEIRHLGGQAETWIELFGRERYENGRTCRVMSIDIGGGTGQSLET